MTSLGWLHSHSTYLGGENVCPVWSVEVCDGCPGVGVGHHQPVVVRAGQQERAGGVPGQGVDTSLQQRTEHSTEKVVGLTWWQGSLAVSSNLCSISWLSAQNTVHHQHSAAAHLSLPGVSCTEPCVTTAWPAPPPSNSAPSLLSPVSCLLSPVSCLSSAASLSPSLPSALSVIS